MTVLALTKTRTGLPALWESGGGASNTGEARIIAGANGEVLKPLYVNGRGHLSCGSHALHVAKPGMIVVDADHHRGDFRIIVYRIDSVDGDEAAVTALGGYAEGVADDCVETYRDAVEAATSKARCYHCREPHYIATEAA